MQTCKGQSDLRAQKTARAKFCRDFMNKFTIIAMKKTNSKWKLTEISYLLCNFACKLMILYDVFGTS